MRTEGSHSRSERDNQKSLRGDFLVASEQD